MSQELRCEHDHFLVVSDGYGSSAFTHQVVHVIHPVNLQISISEVISLSAAGGALEIGRSCSFLVVRSLKQG